MNIDLRQPSFVGTDKEKLEQIANYLYQMQEQLQWAFNALDDEVITATEKATAIVQGGGTTIINNSGGVPTTEKEILETFNNLKSFIINSADIVQSYYTKINDLIIESGEYVASSEYGKFKKNVETQLSVNDGAIKVSSEKLQELTVVVDGNKTELQGTIDSSKAELEGVIDDNNKELQGAIDANGEALKNLGKTYGQTENYAKIIKENGYMKAGFLGKTDGASEYGIEIGYERNIDGMQTEISCGRFTSQEVVFFDQKQNRGAWLSNETLHSNRVDIVSEIRMGGFVDKVDTQNKRIITKWVGVEE